MKTLFKKALRRLKKKGTLYTVKKVVSFSFKKLTKKQKDLPQQLKEQIDLHCQSYFEITRLAAEVNNSVHPKHRIIGYHQFFLDNIGPEDSILDIGCGNGYLAYDLAHKAKEVIGIDIVPENIAFAQGHYRKNNLQFLVGNATTYTYGRAMDKIVLSNVLEHIEKRQEFLDNLHPIARTILLRVPLITRDWLSVYKKENGFEYRLDKTHFIEYRPEELVAELGKSNWQVESFQINWGEWWGVVKEI